MTFVIINPTWVSTTGSDKRTTRRSSEEKEEFMETTNAARPTNQPYGALKGR
jgi:hypothetical protein